MIANSISHYQITAKLGEGGMGEVYRATDTLLGREVAIKILPADIDKRARGVDARDQADVRQLGRAAHENDVRRLDVAMNQTVCVQVRQGARQREPNRDAFLKRQRAAAVQIKLESAGTVEGEVGGRRSGGQRSRSEARSRMAIAGMGFVG